MFAAIRKIFLSLLLVMLVLASGAWQGNQVAHAQSGKTGIPETPLFPGLKWKSLGSSTEQIRTDVAGNTISLSGEKQQAAEQFPAGVSQEVLNFYSNGHLAKSGWESYDSFDGPDGTHFVFYHESGVYLSVEFLKCQDGSSSTCVSVWKSEQVTPATASPAQTASSDNLTAAAASTFNKKSPSNGATNLSASNTTLSWFAYSPSPEKYAYCVNEGSACPNNDPNWTSTYNTSVTLSNLLIKKTYYWQVRALICGSCTPKTFVYADSSTSWKFSTGTSSQIRILGNAGVSGALLSYFDSSNKSVTADSTGAYSITIPYNWSGTITPSKSGYTFVPPSASFSNVTVTQTIQNFAAIVSYTISGNVGVAGATLNYTNGTPQTATSDSNGNYSFLVPSGWSGTVTPAKAGYSFSPPNRLYSSVASNQTGQNYTATFITYTISGTTGIGGVTLVYTNFANGAQSFVQSNGSGNYSLTVPMGWNGSVTPNLPGRSFSPASKSYGNVQANQTGQNYTSSVCASCYDKDTVGVFRPTNGALYLKNENVTGVADIAINYGLPGDYPVTGDWDGNGTTTIGVFRSGVFYLRNENTVGIADVYFPFGLAGDQPIAGDWNGDGVDTVGVFRRGTFYLTNSPTGAGPVISFALGNPGDIGIAGDWTNKGYDSVGVFRPSNGVIYLKNSNSAGPADTSFNYGIAGDKPVAGDWNNDGTDTIGVFRGNTFYLRNSNTSGPADLTFALGLTGDMPIAGNWDGKP